MMNKNIENEEIQHDEYKKDLWGWFGLSYASFLVMPRVAMHAMPDEWQEKMALLLHEYDETINTSAFGVKGCTVRATDGNGKLAKMPEELLNYRRPSKETIAEIKSK